jgi:hypothetical protein
MGLLLLLHNNYYHFLNKDSLKDLTSYFNITDKEDGDIVVTPSMISGEITLNQESIITATYKDTDGNTVKKLPDLNARDLEIKNNLLQSFNIDMDSEQYAYVD